jgi:hypothetical protein
VRGSADDCNPKISHYRVLTEDDVLRSKPVASVSTQLECARRADGGTAVILASAEAIESRGHGSRAVAVLGTKQGLGFREGVRRRDWGQGNALVS